MIGVLADPEMHEVAREFFELFKTPWEFYRENRNYDVVLCCGREQFDGSAPLIIVYSNRQAEKPNQEILGPRIATSNRYRFPLYCGVAACDAAAQLLLIDDDSKECLAFAEISEKKKVVSVGYDLFAEIQFLLTIGQPAAHAAVPTLELHISFLRDLIVDSGISLLEVPPVPNGYRFITCLTHDVDHPSLRMHGWDHTVLGFFYRATFGSFVASIRGRMPLQNCMRNCIAAIKLFFVRFGLAHDPWTGFAEEYLQVEQGRCSTFFFIPFANLPGRKAHGSAPAFRAARYGVKDLRESIAKLQNAGCEIGLHGIDAWIDAQLGRLEIEEIQHLSGTSRTGVRMHWLYFDQSSPERLQDAGADYDSTIGYNETVGYRAGTTQAFKPLAVGRLLELPLHVMDTALFYPTHLGLSPAEAKLRIQQIQANIIQFGGCLTTNWHDRSIAPERLWGATYRDLLESSRALGAWFATASQAVTWFRRRRSVVFEVDSTDMSVVRVRSTHDNLDDIPALILRIHRAIPLEGKTRYVDHALEGSLDVPTSTLATC